ncbi:uncharacterized protein LOC129602434 [Paramacrobiotus metropolitanus]|uniref:uncharacterized protein LOC129602434 n=1 Tax=Paramacrobiotus metropolitanus TaxID=2943436 RepID=UPI00244606C2|nr:uncharacterized protein LOC129602434 [Paramacrobiotus metropolitanus]
MPIQVYQSNSVDVLGDDGLLRYGRVVDIADDGLFIDFLCPTRTREHTPFSSVYLPTSLEPLHMREIDRPRTVPTAPIPVEVLIRETPFDSWMWVPAKMESLVSYEAPALYGMALVRWWNKMQFEDIVPLERIRWRIPGPGGWWGALGMPAPSQFALTLLDCGEGIVEGAVFAQPDAVIKGKFSKWSMALPKELAVNGYILQRYNWELWMREPFCCVNFADGRLQCIERRTAAEKAEAVSEKEARYSNLEGATDSFDGVLGLMCSFYPNKCLLYVSTQDEAPVDEIDALTVEVWQEVFSHLETWDQNRLRTVCFAWNAILESSVITAQLVLKTTGYSGTFETSRTLVPCMMSTIFNCLRASTKHIILSDPERILYVEDLLQLLDVINYTGKRNTEVSVLAIWLVGCRCKFSLGMISYADECVVHHSDHSVNQFHGRATLHSGMQRQVRCRLGTC